MDAPAATNERQMQCQVQSFLMLILASIYPDAACNSLLAKL